MKYCNNCGVILEDDMQICPLCGYEAGTNSASPEPAVTQPAATLTRQQKKLVWEIVSLVLISSIIAALLINLIVNKTISWSEYPVAVCLTIFCYVSFFAFWSGSSAARMLGGFITSAVLLLLLDAFTGGLSWAATIAIPVLLVASLITAIFLSITRHTVSKGVNLIAYAFIGSAVLCVAIEGILSFYHTRTIRLEWSLIVCLCVLLVAIALLFLHFRLKKGRSLEKTFHR
ncbi:hypothetical protein MRBLMN1_003806 [Chitinophaga ginsengisegetis]|uniref:DUF6320 domain-containing protein n=1 Tax=Chitinophaga ginsengisegetis TaxID=393003 RepID=UPI000DBA991E|nr:DUF6320 domain-containing protein [Chitinophaga ginsengisegetis]MDR6568112.1 energy-converting hydrogenase Eha subunit A [Chitinophaga ginsengisegetis]MDR6647333.1 energy-converting hydrogenase Eha subunit A [Chitinophaga ginsengisegetis]MDR6653682.1 energy-converting hydrogenase Eha subunit A [Chitinophaga ginsengisegetis]